MAVDQAVDGKDDPVVRSRLRALLSAVTVSSFGDGALMGALPLAAAAVTRDPTAVASVTAAMYLPWLLVSPIAGALVDRWPYKPVMIVSDAVRGVVLVALTLLVVFDAATIPVLSVVAFIVVAGQIFHDTAVQGTVAFLGARDPQRLDRINGRIYSGETAGKSLLGPPAGSAAYAAVAWLPFAADALSFFASSVLLGRLPNARATEHPKTTPLLTSIGQGAAWLARHAQLRVILLLSSAANLAYNMAWAVLVLFATDGLQAEPATYGLLVSAYAIGGVVMGPLTGRVTERFGAIRSIILVSVVHAIAWPLIALASNPWPVAPLLALIGAAQTVTTVCIVGLRQTLVPSELLGRVTAAFRTVGNSASPVGALIGGLLAATWGLRLPLVVAGFVLIFAVGVAIAVLLRKHLLSSR